MKRWEPAGSVSIVTGASSGIGNCLARLLAEQGSTVYAVARRRAPLQQLLEDSAACEGTVIPCDGDITDEHFRNHLTDTVAEQQDRVDLLVNNAGIGAIGPFGQASPERLRRVMEVNFFAAAELTRSCLPLLQRGRLPVICNVGSVLGHCGVPNKSEYCASKFAIHGWSDSLRAELRQDGIQVTLVSPSTTRSEFFDSLIDTSADQSSQSIGSWPPERVAERTLAAIKARRREVILSLGGKILVYSDRIAPWLIAFILGRSTQKAPPVVKPKQHAQSAKD